MENNITRILLEQIKEIDSRDEDQILTEIAGETVTEMIYETSIKDRKTGKMVKKVKLSWAGTKEAARSRGNIMVDDYPQVSDAGDGLRIIVRVTDLARNFSIFGGCHQPYKMKVYDIDKTTGKIKDTRYEDDPYCFQKGLSKAQRNALQVLMPTDYLAKCINKFLLSPSSKQQQITQTSTKPTKPRISSNIPEPTELKTLFDLEKHAFNRWHLQPADIYKELGYSSRTDVNEEPWELYLKLKANLEE